MHHAPNTVRVARHKIFNVRQDMEIEEESAKTAVIYVTVNDDEVAICCGNTPSFTK